MKKILLATCISIPMILCAELTNIQYGDAVVKATQYQQEFLKTDFDKSKIDSLCYKRMENDNGYFKDKTQEYTQLVYNKCVENLKLVK